MITPQPKLHEKWRYRQNRGSGTFTVIRLAGQRVQLRAVYDGKVKTISVATLRGDYEPAA